MEAPRSTAKLITVFGGSGFIGRYVCQALARRGHRIRVAVRRPDLAGHVQPLGMVGQIKPIQANLRYRWSIDRAVEGADAVINLVGILAQSGRQTFDAVQSFGPRAIGEAARAAGAKAVVHLSAIGADQPSTIGYIRSKAEGEAGLLEGYPDAVIMRPSIVFGPEDHFFNRFAAMARLAPALPLIGGGKTKFQPVFAADVGEAIARAVDGQARKGRDLRAGRAGGAELPTVHGAHAGDHRAAAHARARALVAGADHGPFRRAGARPAADARPGAHAALRQCRVGGRQEGQPHAGGARDRADGAGDHSADLSHALPRARPVHAGRRALGI